MIPDSYKKIDELCTLINGNGFRPPEWSDHGYPIIRIQNLNGSREFNYYAQEPKEKWIVKNGDLLFAWAGVKGVSFGPTIWNGPTGVLNQHIYKIVANEGVNKLWLYSMLNIITSQIESKAHGFKSSLLHVHKSDITDQIVRLPPFLEQCRIAEILGVWDESIDLLERLIGKTRSRKQGLMQQLLTGKKRFKEFNYSKKDWEKVSFDNCVSSMTSGLSRKLSTQDIGIPVLRSSNIGEKYVNFEDLKYWYLEDPQGANTKNYILDDGDILINFINSISQIGKACIFKDCLDRDYIYTTHQ